MTSTVHMRPAACMCRVTGPDPQRRKVSHASFFGAVNGQSTLTNSATLFLASRSRTSASVRELATPHGSLHVYAVCSADIIAPFLHTASRSPRSPELLPGTRLDLLLEGGPGEAGVAGAPEGWWACELKCIGDVEGVDDAIDVLTQQGADWELGWSKPNYPPPLTSVAARGIPTLQHDAPSVPTVLTFGGPHRQEQAQSSVLYPNGRRRSAAQIAVLKVLRLRSEIDAELAAAKPPASEPVAPAAPAQPAPSAAWPAHFPPVHPASFPPFEVHSWMRSCCGPVPRGTPVSVTSSPYGLLSPTIFHNSLTKGIVANWVSVPDRKAGASGSTATVAPTSHFGRARVSHDSTLLHSPPVLLLLDARCFSGSEGAPVLLEPGVQTRCSATAVAAPPAAAAPSHLCHPDAPAAAAVAAAASASAPLLGMVTLPLRHTTRGSAVELTLAIPAPRIHTFLTSIAGLHVWEAGQAAGTATGTDGATATTSSSSGSTGRGEGWRMMQSVRRRPQPQATMSVADNGYGALLSISTAASSSASAAAGVAPHAVSAATPPSYAAPPLFRHPTSALAARTPPPPRACSAALSPTAQAVEHAERSVLMAKIGGSWASAIVLTADGYLLTNAHLLRPFLQSPASAPSSGAAEGSAFTPSVAPPPETDSSDPSPPQPLPLLYDSAIKLQPHVHLSVRVEAHHHACFAPGASTGGGGGAGSEPLGLWLPARVIYISQGAWDVAVLKVECEQPLCPITFHPASLSSPSSLPVGEELPAVGSNVLVVGHALFSPSSALLPTITAGILSKVVRLSPSPPAPPAPALLCSTAAVHNGNSGGLLVHESSGVCLGMVTSNIMHTALWPHHFPVHVRTGDDSSADEARIAELQAAYDEAEKREEEARSAQSVPVILPHLNFTTPYTALLPLRQFCLSGAQDVSVLRELDASSPLLARLWQLQELHPAPPAQPRLHPKYRALIEKLEREEAARQQQQQQSAGEGTLPSKM